MATTKKPAKPRAMGKTQRHMAKHLDMSQQRVAQFVKDEVFPTLADGTLDEDVCRVAYIRWLRDDTRKSTAAAQTSRVQEARAREIEVRTAKEEGRLWEADTAEAVFAEAWGMFRSELSGVPAASTRDLSIRAEITKQINDALDRCDARLANGAAGLRANKEIGDLEGEEPDAG